MKKVREYVDKLSKIIQLRKEGVEHEVFIYERNDFDEPRLPIHRKALNYLTWNIRFPLVNNSVLMFRLPALCCKTSIYPGFSPVLLRVVLSGSLEMLSPGLEVLKIPTD